MLKTKLHKAGFIFTSFMLMAAASGNKKVTVIAGPSEKMNVVMAGDSICMHVFDSAGYCICLPELTLEEKETAPRFQLQKVALDFVTSNMKDNGLYYEMIKSKNQAVFSMIDKVFAEYAIPKELKYLALVESKMDSRIVSAAGAAGLWQFMPQAARSFGLKTNSRIDERKNDYKSTIAAAKCLEYLHNEFGDWLLTLAAYNTGPAKIKNAIRKSGSRDYWVIQRYLPAETRKHVLKFISAHYYFEGHGSLVTMSVTETTAHIKAVEDYVSSNTMTVNLAAEKQPISISANK